MKRYLVLIGLFLMAATAAFGQYENPPIITAPYWSITSTVEMDGDGTQYVTPSVADSTNDTLYVAFPFSYTGNSAMGGNAGLYLTASDTIVVTVYAYPAIITANNSVSHTATFTGAEMRSAANTPDSLVVVIADTLYAGTYFYPDWATRASGNTPWGPCDGLQFIWQWWTPPTSVDTTATVKFEMRDQ